MLQFRPLAGLNRVKTAENMREHLERSSPSHSGNKNRVLVKASEDEVVHQDYP